MIEDDRHDNNHRIFDHLVGISRFSYLLARDLRAEWTEAMLEGIIGYFYEKLLKEHNVELNMKRTVEDIHREINSYADDNLRTDRESTLAVRSSTGITDEEWTDFFCLCTIKKDGIALEKVFEESRKGIDPSTIELAVKYDRILRILRENRKELIPSRFFKQYIKLEELGFVPFTESDAGKNGNNGERHKVMQPSTSYSPSRNRSQINDRSEESRTPAKRGRKNHTQSFSSGNGKRQKRSPEDIIWWRNFDKLIQYHEDYGTYNVPEDEVILDDDEETSIELGKWLKGEKEKYPNYMAVDEEKYAVLTDLACEGLWTTEEETASKRPPTLRRNRTPSNEQLVPTSPQLADQLPEPHVNSSSSSQVIPSVTQNEVSQKKPFYRNLPSRKSNEPSKLRPSLPNPNATYLPAEPKSVVHLGRRQEKQIDPRQNSRLLNSILAEPKLGGGADFEDDSDGEVQLDIRRKYRPNEASSSPSLELDSKIIYKYGDAEQYIGIGAIESEKNDRSKGSKERSYTIKRILPKSPQDGVNSEFLQSREYHEINLQDILHADISITKGNVSRFHVA